MKIIEQSITFEEEIDGEAVIRKIENAAKCCYQATHKVGTLEEAQAFVRSLVRSGHESTIEHVSVSARVITNRGVSHEWVRHRIGCSYSQESTRYCNYGAEKFGAEITVIWPWYCGEPYREFLKEGTNAGFPFIHGKYVAYVWYRHMEACEKAYFDLLEKGCSAQEARGVLPNDLKTEFVVTMTLRAWRHFIKLRAAPTAHPQIRALAFEALVHLKHAIPAVFDDLTGLPEARR